MLHLRNGIVEITWAVALRSERPIDDNAASIRNDTFIYFEVIKNDSMQQVNNAYIIKTQTQ